MQSPSDRRDGTNSPTSQTDRKTMKTFFSTVLSKGDRSSTDDGGHTKRRESLYSAYPTRFDTNRAVQPQKMADEFDKCGFLMTRLMIISITAAAKRTLHGINQFRTKRIGKN